MRYRNYKSFSVKSRQMIPNIISESVVDYFVDSNIVHPYTINTSIFGKSCNIYLPTTNLNELRNYLFTKNFELFNSFSEINFFTQKTPFYSDTLHYGNYYGYATKNEYDSQPIGKFLSSKIVDELDTRNSHVSQITFDTLTNTVVSTTLMTTNKNITKSTVLSLVDGFSDNNTKITLIPINEVPEEFNTNNNKLHEYYELPSNNSSFIGSDPNSPNRILPLYLRYIAKNIVNSELMDECLISANYNQSSSTPISLSIDGFGTEKFSMESIYNCIMDVFPLSLKQIKDKMNFNQSFYRQSCEKNYVNLENVPWEKTDKSKDLIIF